MSTAGTRHTLVLHSAAELDGAAILSVVEGRRLRLSAELSDRMAANRAAALHRLRTGEGVYGVDTGMGRLSSVRLDEAQQAEHQHNLLLARAVGGPPWLGRADVRAVFAVRLATFLSGDAGVSLQLCQTLLGWLNDDLTPAVPATQSGSAGEIIPLCHAFSALIGLGRLLMPDGTLRRSREVLAERERAPCRLGPKEGIALLQGVPVATALALRHCAAAAVLVSTGIDIASTGLAAIRASRDPYSARHARGDDVLAGVLRQVRQIAGEEDSPRALQAPVSFRVIGSVFAHLRRSVTSLGAAVERALVGVTDSPAFLHGEFLGGAGFHGIELAAAADHLVAALAHSAEVSTARIHRLLDPKVTGLPAQLTPSPGPQAGMVAVHKRAVGATHELRRLAVPVALGTMETSTGQEDVQSFALDAMANTARALELARVTSACEALVTFQATALAAHAAPPLARPLLDRLAAVVPEISSDRQFGEDIQRVVEILS
ncbi:MAG: aromatic amino acid lyase [Sciscionella sp.]